MKPAAPRPDEVATLASLRALDVLDSAPEAQFDALARAAAIICQVPIALISLVDSERQWFKANWGLDGVAETPRSVAFCAHTVLGEDILEVPDALADPRFAGNPLVSGAPGIRFYAGAPLRLSNGHCVGSVCVIDRQPRVLDADQKAALRCLAVAAAQALEGRQAARRVKESSASALRAELVLQHSADAIIGIDTAQCIVRWNAAAERLFGYAPHDIIGKPLDLLIPAELQEAARNELCALEPGKALTYEAPRLHADGSRIPVAVTLVPEFDAQGALLGATKFLRDMSEWRKAETALESERQRLASIIESGDVSTWEWNVAGSRLVLSERWGQMLGLDPQLLAPQTLDVWLGRVHPDDVAALRAALAAHLDAPQTAFASEHRLRTGDGSWIWCLARGRVVKWTAQGKPEWMYGTQRDVTARKQQEEALRKSQGFLDRTGKLAGVGGWEFDIASSAVLWSAETCRIHGVSPDFRPTLGEAVRFYAPESRPLMQAAMERALDLAEPWDLELSCMRADGEAIWVRAVGHVEIENGKPVRLVGALQDISERVAERLALKKANDRVALATQGGGIGIWERDFVTGERRWDDCMYRLFGMPAGTAIREPDMARRIHPQDLAEVNAIIAAARINHQRFETEYRVTWDDGSVHSLRSAAHVVVDPAGEVTGIIGTAWDITDIRQIAAELAEQHELLRVTLESIGDAVITTDARGLVQWLNPIAERMTGWSSQEAKDRPVSLVFNILHEETRKTAPDPIASCLEQGQIVGLAGQSVLVSRQGTEYGIEDSAAPIRNALGEVLGAVLVFHDVSEQRRMSGEMSYRATHDALTGLVNRAEFEVRLERTLKKAREEGNDHALLYVDLDQFKLVNDACGHSVGDELLQQVSKLLGAAIRSRDTLARLGGDEFGIILEHCTVAQAQVVAQKICDRMEDFRFVHDERRFRVGTSIGLVPIDSRWGGMAAILQAADSCCYAAKEGGRNRVHTWHDADLAMHARHGEMQWVARIEQALDEGRFVLYAQQIFGIGLTATGVRAEVLLRMQDVDGAIIAPGAFLPAAERFHLASRIDRWVLQKAIAWMQDTPFLDELDSLSVNLSGQSIGDRAFHRWASQTLADCGPRICARLCLEVTETAAITNMADAAVFIEEVRASGVKVALDDFGAGASSFGYLKSMPVDILKIDGQFVRDLVSDPLDQAAVRCFVEVAKAVGVATVAEFVDHPAVLERLESLGVNFAQGYLLHRPAPLDALRGVLADAAAAMVI
jgi:diguanylate cyclase (GGDEF)-like protein/PAS domain S-box-containing protein